MLNCVSSNTLGDICFYCGNDKFIYNGTVRFHCYSVQYRMRLHY